MPLSAHPVFVSSLMSAQTLSVMTLNTWGFRWPLARDRTLRFGRIARHLGRAQYDIVALQEMWGGARRAMGNTALSWLARPLTLARRGMRMEDSGLAVKLRPELESGACVRTDLTRAFSRGVGWDWFKSKGIYTVDVAVANGAHVTVVTTHLQAGQVFAGVRRSQLDELLLALEDAETPVVLLGDFNFHRDCREDQAAQRALSEAGFVDAAESVDRAEPTYLRANPYVPNSDMDERFDRIYVRDGAEHALNVETTDIIVDHAAPMSDHEALVARIRVSDRSASGRQQSL